MINVVNAIILSRDKSKFLVIKRKEGIHAGKWAFPGGMVEKGEIAEQALKREIKEEVGLDITKIIRKISEYEYNRKEDSINKKEKSRGQCFLTSVKNSNVKIGKDIDDFKWATIEEFEEMDYVEGLEEEALSALYEIQTNKNPQNIQ